jgi:hypothetical protein
VLHESWIPAYAGMTTFYEAINLASIPESKIVDYLLSDKHRVGKSKAAFFKLFGFRHER